jgi:hypothetical protein
LVANVSGVVFKDSMAEPGERVAMTLRELEARLGSDEPMFLSQMDGGG